MKQPSLIAMFEGWLNSAEPGQQFVYHEGFLLQDINRKVMGMNYTNLGLQKLRSLVMETEGQGLVELVQRKVGEGRYQYIAVKRRFRRVR